MVDPEPRADASSTRRDRRAQRVRRRWRAAATGVTVALLVIGFGLVITDVVRFGGGDRPSLARTVEAPVPSVASSNPPASTPNQAGLPCRSPLTEAAPLRLWIGGDSLAGSLGPALGALAGATGVVQPQFDSRVSSGLSNPGFFDWPTHAAKEMTRLDPEVAVFLIGANDFPVPLNTRVDDKGNEIWKTEYTAKIDEMLTALGAEERTVIWLSAPPFGDNRNEQIREIDALMQAVLAKHRNAIYVDTYELFSDDQGKYQASLPPLDDPGGTAVAVRTGDGVHFTQQGADRIGTAVFELLDARCKATKQAVPGVVKVVLQTPGSTQAVGGLERGGTVQTSPPATSAPTTTTSAPAATPSSSSTTTASTTPSSSTTSPTSSTTTTSTTTTLP
jgi:hypothetical protein